MNVGKKVKAALAGEFTPSASRVSLTPGEAVRIAREHQGMSQSDLAKTAGIPQSAISAIESGRVPLGVERTKRLAIALRVHPSVLLFPSWEAERKMLDRGKRVA
jgi:transcriptional regulator with XRE-family HTH domain